MSPLVMMISMRLAFVFWLIVAYGLFVWRYKRRRYFVLRVGGSVIGLLGIAALSGWGGYELMNFLSESGIHSEFTYPVINIIVHLMLFGLSISALFLCFDEKPVTLLFGCIAGYALQNIGVIINNLEGLIWPQYKFISLEPTTWQGVVIWITCYITTYTITYLLFARSMKNYDEVARYNSGATMILFFIVVGIAVVVRSWSSSYAYESKTLFVLMSVCNVCCCFVVLFMQFMFSRWAMIRQENTAIRYMSEQKMKQYEFTKENIDLINLKCHDLKHQLIELKNGGGKVDKNYIDKLQESISFYDSGFETGNAALDTVLSDKNLYCVKNKIQLSAIADGKLLSFMEVADIYSLFGNALDNAIEYVMTLTEEKRVIKLSVSANGSLIGVLVKNYYEGEPMEMRSGIPRTTKKDKFYHGYGIKSMKNIAEKYGGSFSVNAVDEEFIVSILMNGESK